MAAVLSRSTRLAVVTGGCRDAIRVVLAAFLATVERRVVTGRVVVGVGGGGCVVAAAAAALVDDLLASFLVRAQLLAQHADALLAVAGLGARLRRRVGAHAVEAGRGAALVAAVHGVVRVEALQMTAHLLRPFLY